MAIDYGVFYSRKGAAYRPEHVVDHSAYLLPVDTRPGRLAGNSRIWGDATHEVQRKVIDAIIVATKKDGFDIRRMAMLLAMANYRTNPVTMVSPVGSRIPVSYKVIGIWYKEQA